MGHLLPFIGSTVARRVVNGGAVLVVPLHRRHLVRRVRTGRLGHLQEGGTNGEPAWSAFVPVYNYIVLLRIVGRPKTWAWFLLLLGPLPSRSGFLGSIAFLVINIIVFNDLSKSFGHGDGIHRRAGAPVGDLLVHPVARARAVPGTGRPRGSGRHLRRRDGNQIRRLAVTCPSPAIRQQPGYPAPGRLSAPQPGYPPPPPQPGLPAPTGWLSTAHPGTARQPGYLRPAGPPRPPPTSPPAPPPQSPRPTMTRRLRGRCPRSSSARRRSGPGVRPTSCPMPAWTSPPAGRAAPSPASPGWRGPADRAATRVEFDGHPGPGPRDGLNRSMFSVWSARGMHRVVEVDRGVGQGEPAVGPLGAALHRQSGRLIRAHGVLLSLVGSLASVTSGDGSGLQVAAEELPDPLPAVVGRLGPVTGPVDGEEGVAGVLVGVELELLACFFSVCSSRRPPRGTGTGPRRRTVPSRGHDRSLARWTMGSTLSGNSSGGVPTTKAP